jgi:NAD(P)-dependent dehydrogenase (short-subunit alcohol dehydrogenase family)
MKLVVVSGASKGFGRAVVQSLLESSIVPSASVGQVHFALFGGADREGLASTADLLTATNSSQVGSTTTTTTTGQLQVTRCASRNS